MSKVNNQSVCHTFLFGAGADSQFGLVNGVGFNGTLLKNQYSNERKSLLGEEYASHQLIFPQSKTVFLQTIYENREDAIQILGDDVVEKCCSYYVNKNEEDRQVISEWCKQWYNKLIEDVEDESSVFFINNASFFTSLDEKFNDLRHPFMGAKGKRVINAYYSIFLLMFKSLYDIDKVEWNLKYIWDKLRSDNYNEKIDLTRSSYYQTLAQSNLRVNIITTNYTSIAEQIIKKPITYLHGNLCWFEDLEKLAVYDCKNDEDYEALRNNSNHLVPFILIPSGIKPLICAKQIEQFHNFVKCLSESSVLCIVGYKFNSEDNHINSIIAEWLRKHGHRIIYLNFKGEFDWKKCIWAKELYSIETIYANSDMDLSKILLTNAQIVNIVADGNNSQTVFESIVQILEKKQNL